MRNHRRDGASNSEHYHISALGGREGARQDTSWERRQQTIGGAAYWAFPWTNKSHLEPLATSFSHSPTHVTCKTTPTSKDNS
jgi:hypothetical protein